ncbi:MAG: hypothetical protein H6819_06745 [Phycisphaerales bacterium]|nr:hypothetical protein [Phycisphaerales bacterium]MCB9855279.1 hypothetical protein [Phycisphaerales bacterium]MCB9862872.1 hypothetical protein [Phycisphaerales bacterium]
MAAGAPTILGSRKTGKTPGRILLPYQIDWINDESPTKLGDKSRRTGWTWCEAYDSVSRRFRGTNPRPLDYWFSSADESAAYEFIQYGGFFAKDLFGRIADMYTDQVEDPETRKGYVNAFVIRCPNKARITAMTSNPRRFRSKGGDTRCDEYAFHDDAEGMNDAASPCTMWGGTYAVWSTPNGELSVFNRFVQNCRKVLAALGFDPNKPPRDLPYQTLQKKALEMRLTPIFSYHRVTIIDAIEQGLVDKINSVSGSTQTREQFLDGCRSKSRGEDAFQQEYMCVASVDAMAWLSYKIIEACEDDRVPHPGEPMEGHTGGPLAIGIDVGREKDLTFAPIGELVGDVIWPRQTITLQKMSLVDQAGEIVRAVEGKRVLRLCIDNTGIGVGLADILEKKFGPSRIERINFTAQNKEILAVGLKQCVEDRGIRFPARNQKVRDSLHKIRKSVTAAGNIRFDAPRDSEGHADEFWGFALLNEAFRTPDAVKPEYTPIDNIMRDYGEGGF